MLRPVSVQVEAEDLVLTLEGIVEKFGEEIAPYAVGLCQHLTNAFWRTLQVRRLAASAQEYWPVWPGALAIAGCQSCAMPEAASPCVHADDVSWSALLLINKVGSHEKSMHNSYDVLQA